MKALLAPVGTRGDVQPLVALGLELRRRGHAVTVAAPANFATFVQEHGLTFRPACRSYSTFTDSLRDRPFLQVLREQIPEQFEHLLAASSDTDVVVGSMLQMAGPSVAQATGVPYAFMHPAPVFLASTEHPPVTESRQNLGPEANGLCWEERARAWEHELAPALNAERRTLGLSPVIGVQDHVLHRGRLLLASEVGLAGQPQFVAPDVQTTGAWFLDEGELAPAIEAFCRAGEPPLLIGFGSMRFRPAAELAEMFVQAARISGTRVIIASGWAEIALNDAGSDCLVIREAPYHLLLPLVRAIIHHGGAGTVHAAARAGIPQGLVPHFADQPYWAHRIQTLGLGPPAIPICELTAVGLAGMMKELTGDPKYSNEAATTGRTIDSSQGVKNAADLLEELAEKGTSS